MEAARTGRTDTGRDGDDQRCNALGGHCSQRRCGIDERHQQRDRRDRAGHQAHLQRQHRTEREVATERRVTRVDRNRGR